MGSSRSASRNSATLVLRDVSRTVVKEKQKKQKKQWHRVSIIIIFTLLFEQLRW